LRARDFSPRHPDGPLWRGRRQPESRRDRGISARFLGSRLGESDRRWLHWDSGAICAPSLRGARRPHL